LKLKKLRRIGNSLCFTVPSEYAEDMLRRGEALYATIIGSSIAYSHDPLGPSIKVKLRPLAKHGDKVYYALTVPSKLAAKLGLDSNAQVEVEYNGEKLILRKANNR